MKKYILTWVAACTLLSGCGIYSKYKPASSVPENLYGEGVATADTVGLGATDWRELFTDPYLRTLIERGLCNNTDYLSAGLRVKEAEAALLSAKLAYLPSFALAPPRGL